MAFFSDFDVKSAPNVQILLPHLAKRIKIKTLNHILSCQVEELLDFRGVFWDFEMNDLSLEAHEPFSLLIVGVPGIRYPQI